MSNPGPNPDFSPIPSDISIDLLPNELHTQMLLFLSPIQRLAVARTQWVWQFLDASISLNKEQAEYKSEAIARQLLAAIAEGKKEIKILLTSLTDEIKTPDVLNSWLWLALRLAAKQGHFENMFLLLQEYKFNERCAPLFEHIDAMTLFPFITEEQKRISENIDAIPEEYSTGELSLQLKNRENSRLIQALQIFIANDQAQCMSSIFVLFPPTPFSNKNLLFLMVNHNRFQCLNLFLQDYRCTFRFPQTEQDHFNTLKALITLATEKDYVECLQILLFLTINAYGNQGLRFMHETASAVVHENPTQRWKCVVLLAGMQFDSNNQKRKREEENEDSKPSNKKPRPSPFGAWCTLS